MLSTLKPLEAALSGLLRECSNLSLEETTPILLTRPASNRSSRLEKSKTMWHEVDACLGRVFALQRDLVAASQLLTTYKTKLAHSSSLVSAIPTEILLIIFEFVWADIDGDGQELMMPMHLSQVCSRWRPLVLSEATIWRRVPVTAKSSPDMLLEYGRRAKDLPLTLRVMDADPERHRYRDISVPSLVAQNITSIELNHPYHLDWLSFRNMCGNLDVLRLKAVSNGYSLYDFREDRQYSHYQSTNTLICNGAVLVSDEGVDMEFHRLETLKLESQSGEDAGTTLLTIDAPDIKSLSLTDLCCPENVGGAGAMNWCNLRQLHVGGDSICAAVVGDLFERCEAPKLETFTCEIRRDSNEDYREWADGIRSLVLFAQNASAITFASTASSLGTILVCMAGEEFANLTSLKISLICTDGIDADYEISLAESQNELRRFLAMRAERGSHALGELSVSRVLLKDDEAWFAERAALLEVCDD